MKSSGKTLMWIVSIGILVLIPTTGGKVFDALTNKFAPKPPTREEFDAIPRAAAEEPLPVDLEKKYKPVPEKDAGEAKERFIQGLKYFQDETYNKAWVEWLAAEKLDPNNLDVRKGLKRLEQLSPNTKPE